MGEHAFKPSETAPDGRSDKTEAASLPAINQRAEAIFDSLRAKGHTRDIKQSDGKREPTKG